MRIPKYEIGTSQAFFIFVDCYNSSPWQGRPVSLFSFARKAKQCQTFVKTLLNLLFDLLEIWAKTFLTEFSQPL